MKIEFSRQSFEKYSGIKFNENSPRGCRVASRQTDRQTDRLTDKRKLIVPFRNFAKEPKMKVYKAISVLYCLSELSRITTRPAGIKWIALCTNALPWSYGEGWNSGEYTLHALHLIWSASNHHACRTGEEWGCIIDKHKHKHMNKEEATRDSVTV